MTELTNLAKQIWQLLPLLVLFISGYIIYRLLAFHQVTDHISVWFIRKSRGRVPILFLYILCGTTVLSFFISNTIAVLTLLPILKTIRDDFEELGYDKKKITTALTMPLIYGANIGGMGSLIGGPAHIILLGSLEIMGVAGRDKISFGSWFFWSIPLVLLFIITAWLIIVLLATPKKLLKARISLEKIFTSTTMTKLQHNVLNLFIAFLVFWTLQAILTQVLDFSRNANSIIALLFLLLFIYFLFIRKEKSNNGEPYLKFKNLIIGLPPRLLILIGIIIAISIGIRVFSLDTFTVEFFKSFIGQDVSVFVTFLLIVFTVMILTEFFSNTVIATAFMPVAFSISQALGLAPLALMIAVSCGCTCAYMTPIATPSNALAFAEMDGISLRKLLIWGLLMNIIGALILSAYLPAAIPFVYGQ